VFSGAEGVDLAKEESADYEDNSKDGDYVVNEHGPHVVRHVRGGVAKSSDTLLDEVVLL
jgi:hypothetical protein